MTRTLTPPLQAYVCDVAWGQGSVEGFTVIATTPQEAADEALSAAASKYGGKNILSVNVYEIRTSTTPIHQANFNPNRHLKVHRPTPTYLTRVK